MRQFLSTLLAALCVTWAVAAPTPEATARRADIAKELASLQTELQRHGGSFDSWAQALGPYREDLEFLGKVPARAGLSFQGASARVIRCDDLDALPEGCRPFEAIVDFDRQLKARGIDLILAIIPSKLCVYPDFLNVAPGQPARAPADRQVAVAIKRLHQKLLEADVEVIDLYTAYQEARRANQDKSLFVYQQDSHWNNAGCRVAGAKIAERLQRYNFVKDALAKGNPYTYKPGSREGGTKADPDLHLVEYNDGRPYEDLDASPVLLTGDSFSMYNQHLKAHLPAQVALRIGAPVTLLGKEGLSFDLPVKIAEEPRLLQGRRVIVWTFNDKMLPLTPNKGLWRKVELPAASASAPVAPESRTVTATITEISPPPPKNAPYPHCYRLAYCKDLDAVLHILAMHNRQHLPAASLKPGDKIEVKISPWAAVEKTHGRIQSSTLPTVELQIRKKHYLAEVPGAPTLTDADFTRVGEE